MHILLIYFKKLGFGEDYKIKKKQFINITL